MKTDESLDNWRKEIDALDEALLLLLVKRMDIVRKIGVYKKHNGVPARDQKRWDTLLAKLMTKAKVMSINPSLVRKIWNTIHEQALIYETI